MPKKNDFVVSHSNFMEKEHIEIKTSERLKELRKERRLTARDVADFLNIPRPTYTCYEAAPGKSAKREAPIKTLVRLANFYNVSVDYLIGHSDDKTPPGENLDVLNLLDTNENLDSETKRYIKTMIENLIEEKQSFAG